MFAGAASLGGTAGICFDNVLWTKRAPSRPVNVSHFYALQRSFFQYKEARERKVEMLSKEASCSIRKLGKERMRWHTLCT